MNGGGSASRSVVVIGGGLAGLAAAIAAADDGWRVTVVETRPRLGGLTHSFSRDIAGSAAEIDNGQHVFLRCCTAYRAFLHRLGVADRTVLQHRLDLPVLEPGTGRRVRITRDRLPAPYHLLRTLARYRLVGPRDRWTAARALAALRHLDRDAAWTDEQSFAQWLEAHRVTPTAIRRLFDVFTVATLNAPARQVSLRLAAMVFQEGLLTDPTACDIGYPAIPLGRLHGHAAQRVLDRLGARVLLRHRARQVALGPDRRWRVPVENGASHERRELEADAVVIAVPHDRVSELVPPQAIPVSPELLRPSPIINVHVVFDRRVLDVPFAAAVDSPAQFLFDRTASSGLDPTAGLQYLAISVSAAREWIGTPVADLRARFLPELARLLPAAGDARVVDFFVTREPAATFLPEPGSAAYRLATRTRLPGLLLAGAWTDTGWPATMEGAVRSGWAAARALGELRGEPTRAVDLRGAERSNVAAPTEDPARVEA